MYAQFYPKINYHFTVLGDLTVRVYANTPPPFARIRRLMLMEILYSNATQCHHPKISGSIRLKILNPESISKLNPNGIFKKHNNYKLKQSKNNKMKKILDEHQQTHDY